MKTENFKGALLSTLLIVSMIAPAISIISLLSVSPVYAQVYADNIVRAQTTAFNINTDVVAPWLWYGYDGADRPPIMAAKEYGTGAVAAATFVATCRDFRWNATQNTHKYLPYLLHSTFQWMKPGATKVLWYEGQDNVLISGTGRVANRWVYNTMVNPKPGEGVQCVQLMNALENATFGYDITGDNTPVITSSLLAPYDIVVIPQMQDDYPGTGGNPDTVWENEIDALEDFVTNGGGLLVMDGDDSYGHAYCFMANKILKRFDMGMYFQSDSVNDTVNHWYRDWEPLVIVDNAHWIGDNYDNQTGTSLLGVYSVCSLAPRSLVQPTVVIRPGGAIETGHRFYEGLPGGKLVYELTVTNFGLDNDNFTLTAGDNAGWTLDLAQSYFENMEDSESRTTTLTVTIPASATFGLRDSITVEVTSQRDPSKYDNQPATAIASPRVRPVTDDADVSKYGTQADTKTGGYRLMWVSSSSTPHRILGSDHTDRRAWLKFDLRAIPSIIPPGNWDNNNLQARLYAYCFGMLGARGKNVQCYGVDNDNWWEENITWNTQHGSPGSPGLPATYLSTTAITDTDAWYSWDVTSFVRSQLGKKATIGDNFVTFYLRAETENLSWPDNFAYVFYPYNEEKENWRLVYLAIGYDVDTWITPAYGEAMQGGTASFNVRMMNRGSFTDNYSVTAENTKTWTLTLENVENVPPGGIRTANLGVQIPAGATICDNDNIRVTVRSKKYPDNAWDNDNCIAHVTENRISAKEDSTTRGENQLENSLWGRVGTIYIGRRVIYPGWGFAYNPTPERGWLKFDLRGIPSIDNIVMARLNLQCFDVENAGTDIQVRGVDNDNWSELTMNWLNQPSIGSILDSGVVASENMRYSWDVTDFVRSQYQTPGDNVASFCIIDVGENLGPNHYSSFTSSNYGSIENLPRVENHPYLEILSAAPENEVRVYANPTFSGNRAGRVENYIITVSNNGTSSKTYNLTIENTENWTRTLDSSSLYVENGKENSTTLRVTIPSGAVCTMNQITITAKSALNPSENHVTRCYAHRGDVDFKLENRPVSPQVTLGSLYWLKANFKLRVRDNSGGLRMYFYTYDNIQESTPAMVWSVVPYYLDNDVMDPIFVQHSGGKVKIQKAKLFLVDTDNNVMYKVKGWVTIRSDLWTRLGEIRLAWPYATPAERSLLWSELGDIRLQWPYAPSTRDPVWID